MADDVFISRNLDDLEAQRNQALREVLESGVIVESSPPGTVIRSSETVRSLIPTGEETDKPVMGIGGLATVELTQKKTDKVLGIGGVLTERTNEPVEDTPTTIEEVPDANRENVQRGIDHAGDKPKFNENQDPGDPVADIAKNKEDGELKLDTNLTSSAAGESTTNTSTSTSTDSNTSDFDLLTDNKNDEDNIGIGG